MGSPDIGDGSAYDPLTGRLRPTPPAPADDAVRRESASAEAMREACEKAEAMRPPGCAPEGNHASVEVVPTILLEPLDVVWHEDGWHVVIDDAANDESSVTLAPIIDDSGGQDVEVKVCAEFFLRCAPLPAAPATAVEEARDAVVEAARALLVRLEAIPYFDTYAMQEARSLAIAVDRYDALRGTRPEGHGGDRA